MHGEILSYEILRDGSKKLVEKGNNLVVNSAFIVMAMAMKRDPAFGGFLYWALGDGGASVVTNTWNSGVAAGTTAPVKTNTQLLREIYRKSIDPSNITFVDGVGQPSGVPTNRLQIRVTFAESEPGGPSVFLREWGIFGGNATGAAGSGFLINHRYHETYEKTDSIGLERVLRFTF
jgi:hypothetical protein